MILNENFKINKKYTSMPDIGKCIYRIKDFDDNIVYVGKSANLHQDLRSEDSILKSNEDQVFAVEYIELETENDIEFAYEYLLSKHKPALNNTEQNGKFTIEIKELDENCWNLYYINDSDKIEKEISLIRKILNENTLEVKAEEYIRLWSLVRTRKELGDLIDDDKYRETFEMYEIRKRIKDPLIEYIQKKYTEITKNEIKYFEVNNETIKLLAPNNIEQMKAILIIENVGRNLELKFKNKSIDKHYGAYKQIERIIDKNLVREMIAEKTDRCIGFISYNFKLDKSNLI